MADYIITNHVRERYVERFSEESDKFIHLSKCSGCDRCRSLTFELADLVKSRREEWDQQIRAKILEAEKINIFLNNSKFMDYMHKNYGYYRYNFYVNNPILFAVIEDFGKKIKTCMDVRWPVNGSTVLADFMKRPKYKKKLVTGVL
jgi:hypothetical protein